MAVNLLLHKFCKSTHINDYNCKSAMFPFSDVPMKSDLTFKITTHTTSKMSEERVKYYQSRDEKLKFDFSERNSISSLALLLPVFQNVLITQLHQQIKSFIGVLRSKKQKIKLNHIKKKNRHQQKLFQMFHRRK